MPLRNPLSPARPRRTVLSLVIAVIGFTTAMLVGIAIAKSFTLKVEKNAKVTNQSAVTKRETIVTFHGFAVYTLSGETSHHLKCTSATCLQVWPPVKVSSGRGLSKAPGIKGKLGVLHRMGFNQVTLNGHPLYKFASDSSNGAATGEGLANFHVVKATVKKASGSGRSTSTSTSSTSSSTTSTTTSYG
jgi:predicted lipoprotein with Yx(FWY)xxD motif